MELMKIYIDQGRFGEFVTEIIDMDFKRKQEEAEKEEDNRLWLAFIHSASDKNFSEWKKSLQQKKEPEDYSMTDEQVADVKEQAKEILKKISPV